MAWVYIYRMTSDTGLAPCVKNGLLSLSCCKGGQMRGEKVINTGLRYRIGSNRDTDYNTDNVYLLGIYKDKMLYFARVTKVVTMVEYFSLMAKDRTDNIYSVEDGRLVRNSNLRAPKVVPEVHTEAGRVLKDIAGKYVLLSDDYIYLGRDAVNIDSLKEYIPKFQETKKYSGDKADLIITECLKWQDNKEHLPIEPFTVNGGCK